MLIAFDIDGTLADASARLVHIQGQEKNWSKFYEGILDDDPIKPMCTIYRELLNNYEHKIIIMSGRNIKDAQPETDQWLNDYELYYDAIYLRQERDHRLDYIVKCEMLEQVKQRYCQYPDLAFDDSPEVIRAFRNLGIFTIDVCQTSYVSDIFRNIDKIEPRQRK